MMSLRQRMGESTGALRGVFANPNLRRVELAFAGAVLGQYAYSIAVSVYAYLQGGATAVGIVSFARLIVAAAVAPFAATLADRFRRERVMLASDLVRAALVASAAACIFADGPALVVYVLATLTTAARRARSETALERRRARRTGPQERRRVVTSRSDPS